MNEQPEPASIIHRFPLSIEAASEVINALWKDGETPYIGIWRDVFPMTPERLRCQQQVEQIVRWLSAGKSWNKI